MIDLNNNLNAKDWAVEFIRTIREKPLADPKDLGFMVGWFSNAIMAGFDKGKEIGIEEGMKKYKEMINNGSQK